MSDVQKRIHEIEARFEDTMEMDRRHREDLLSIESSTHTKMFYSQHEEYIKSTKMNRKKLGKTIKQTFSFKPLNTGATIATPSNDNAGNKPFSGIFRLMLGMLDIVLGLAFILVVFFIAAALLFPLLSEGVRPIAFVVTLVFSIIVLWRA